jgi:methyl-accepting chemotaxis protein
MALFLAGCIWLGAGVEHPEYIAPFGLVCIANFLSIYFLFGSANRSERHSDDDVETENSGSESAGLENSRAKANCFHRLTVYAAMTVKALQQTANVQKSLSNDLQNNRNATNELISQIERKIDVADGIASKLGVREDMGNKVISTLTKSVEDLDVARGSVDSFQTFLKEIALNLESIEGIALKTRLIGFNASVEAARAGTYGKTFGIVAGEVEALARATSSVSAKIQKQIKDNADTMEKITTDIKATVENSSENIMQTKDDLDAFFKTVKIVLQEISDTGKVFKQYVDLSSGANNLVERIMHQTDELERGAANVTLVRYFLEDFALEQLALVSIQEERGTTIPDQRFPSRLISNGEMKEDSYCFSA